MKYFVLLVLLVACAPASRPQTAQEERVTGATMEAWYYRGMPDVRHCDSELWSFEIRLADQAEFEALCRPEKSKTKWGCTAWVNLEHEAFRDQLRYPVAVFSPLAAQHPELIERMSVHEMIHAMVSCTGTDGDFWHKDARLWSVNNLEEHDETTVQWIAWSYLGEAP